MILDHVFAGIAYASLDVQCTIQHIVFISAQISELHTDEDRFLGSLQNSGLFFCNVTGDTIFDMPCNSLIFLLFCFYE